MKPAIGVDLGGTHLRAALVDVAEGKILAGWQVEVVSKQPDEVTNLLAQAVEKVDPDQVRIAIGIGFAGMLDGPAGMVTNAPNFGWRDVDFGALLERDIREKVHLFNDLNALTMGEAAWGAGQGAADFLMVAVGTGIGGGLVVNNQLYTGANHLAGEVGHTKVIPGGRQCGCGARGCLEAYASGAHLAARAQEDLQKTRSLAVELAGTIDKIHAGHLNEAAKRGDRYAAELLEHAGSLLGLVLGNLVTALNPARLVIGGGVWHKTSELQRYTRSYFAALVNLPSLEKFSLVDALLGDDAGVLGAALLATLGGSP